jgi:uncharacterized protein YndB with AHSA1/START domain
VKTIIVLVLCGVSSLFGESPVKVSKLNAPEKTLRFEVTVPARVEEVWAAFTTDAGLKTWLWPDVSVDLREGGDWLARFSATSVGGGTIVSFTPQRQIEMRAMAPEQFPEVRRERTTAVFEFEPAGKQTRVTLTQTGWKSGKEWEDAYEYLASGNAQLLEQLYTRFAKGPMDWDAMFKRK